MNATRDLLRTLSVTPEEHVRRALFKAWEDGYTACATEFETGDPMTTDPFTPHADSIQTAWVLMCQQSRVSTQPPVEELEAEFDRFIARVRRDAAREALDGLADRMNAFSNATGKATSWDE